MPDYDSRWEEGRAPEASTPIRPFSITVRAATDQERADAGGYANTVDGAAAVTVDDRLIAVFDEYGSCVWTADFEPYRPSNDVLEAFVERALGIWTGSHL